MKALVITVVTISILFTIGVIAGSGPATQAQTDSDVYDHCVRSAKKSISAYEERAMIKGFCDKLPGAPN